MSNFHVGDIVKVIDGGKKYSSYVTKILEMYENDCNLPSHYRSFKDEYLVRYAYHSDESLPLENLRNEYKILYLYEHLALIEGTKDIWGRIYLIDITGIEKAKSKERIYLEGLTKEQLIDMLEKYYTIEEISNERPE